MAIDRRAFLSGVAAAGAAWPAHAREPERWQYASACVDTDGTHAVALFDSAGRSLAKTALPARGHDIAKRPDAREAIVFARRPGRFAVVFDLDGRRATHRFDCEAGFHFFGHGVYSSDGKLLFSTENDVEGGRGVLGIRDASGDYARVGLFATGGIGPHDVALLSDNSTLVVANGGIDTDPTGRDATNLADMRPSLAYLDMGSGALVEQVELDPALRQLSIRHLAVGADDAVVFGCQWEGAATDHPPLVWCHRRGARARPVQMPDDCLRRLRNYIGSVAVDCSGEIAAATAPKGGLSVFFEVATGRFLGVRELPDVCGLSSSARPRELLLTSGDGAICSEMASASGGLMSVSDAHVDVHWDNHIAFVA